MATVTEAAKTDSKGVTAGNSGVSGSVEARRKILYTMRYKHGQGVQMAYITASSAAAAERTAQWWCNQQINHRFIRIDPAVVADEDDVPVDKPNDQRPANPTISDKTGVDVLPVKK